MANTKKIAQDLSNEVAAKYDGLTSIASKCRYLLSEGFARGDVSRIMTAREGREIRYQWIRNIELTPLKKG